VVLRLSFAPKLWSEVSTVNRDFDQVIQRLMAAHTCWMFEPRQVVDRGVTCVRRVLVSGGFEFLLQAPSASEAFGLWDYDVIAMRRETEKGEAVGVPMTDHVLVYPPGSVCDGAVAVLIKVAAYRRLAEYEKAVINLAWKKIGVGRTVRRLVWLNDIILYMPRKLGETVIAEAVEDMGDALESAGVGRVLTDLYELRRVREMAGKFGESVVGA